MGVTCICIHINPWNVLYKKEEGMYFSLKCEKDALTHQHALLPTQCGLNCHDTCLSYWSPAILFSESSSTVYIQRSKVLCNFAWSNHEFANIPKNLAVTITSSNWRATFLAPLSVLQGHFQFFDLMPYLSSPIKIWGKITKRQVHNFRENSKPEADRGW